MIKKYFYNNYHKKNRRVAVFTIKSTNYTYQTIIDLCNTYFIDPSKTVSDFGCGVGTVDFYLAKKYKKIYGFDISDKAIRQSKESAKSLKLNNICFRVLDIQKLSIPISYDYAILSEVVEHLENDREVLEKIYKSMNYGGRLIISTPSLNAPLFRWGLLDRFDTEVGHLRRYNTYSLSKLVETAGFNILYIRKTEGLLRNFLFTNNIFGNLIRFIKYPITIPVNAIDKILTIIFGESSIYIVAEKK